MGIESVAAGYSRPEAEALPLDIQFTKCVDWLVQRRVVSSSWQKSLRVAHAKLSSALAEPRPDIGGVLDLLPLNKRREEVTYFDCVAVVQLLTEAGRATKNFLGQLTDADCARWAEVAKRYEAGSVYLVDTAQFLLHAVTYELPALKKELARAEKELAELQRRTTEYSRLAEASRARFKEMCAKKQIEPCERHEIRHQLSASLLHLMPLYLKVARLCQAAPLPSAVHFYRRFVQFTMRRDKAEGEAEACLQMLARVQLLDLSEVNETSLVVQATGAAEAAAVEIDWGEEKQAEPMAVDWGDDGGGAAPLEVSWGDLDGGDGGVVEVNWGDEAEGGEWNGEIEVEAGGDTSGDGELSLAQIFENDATRNQLIDDLLELHCFFRQRQAEGSPDGLPAELQLDESELSDRLQEAVDAIVQSLDNAHARHLLMLQSSPKYMARQEQTLRQHLDHADKMLQLADELKSREAELMLTIQTAYPKYQAVVSRVKATKSLLEAAISKHFEGRRINLMGEINTI
ncbi:hypothetical protein AB1Y20_000901 [Prymnesium parvum]|uniref:CDK5 regulatory subunit-associated protein 3 n=1 Tax=Prymnesium parvum TaxID=97485 RepID=A0AB34KBR9_PRYPA